MERTGRDSGKNQEQEKDRVLPDLADIYFSARLRNIELPKYTKKRARQMVRLEQDECCSVSLEKANHERDQDRMQQKECRSGGFRCVDTKCGLWVPIHDKMGTKNRNHCPCCLSSRHVDEKIGDRRSHCRARMDAIGLTTKIVPENRYSKDFNPRGELMIIHKCSGCSIHRLNRIAADDNSHAIMELFRRSLAINTSDIETLRSKGINILRSEDEQLVRSQC